MMNQHRQRRLPFPLAILTLGLAWPGATQPLTASDSLAAWFKDPPADYRSRPLYWLNAPLDPGTLREQIQAMRDRCGFGGFAPLTLRTAKPDYLTDKYFERYNLMLELAEKLGLKVIFYDDINFPTGTAGGRLAAQYPDSMLKNLRKLELAVAGPRAIHLPVPEGKLMAAVAMETRKLQRLNLAEFITDGALRWDAPPGIWKVMLFTCVTEGGFVDYLDPDAVRRWMSLTYDQFYRRFGRHFGTTIVQSFFDDAAMVYTSRSAAGSPARSGAISPSCTPRSWMIGVALKGPQSDWTTQTTGSATA